MAKKYNITLNSDKEHVKAIRQALKENNNHCPCQLKKDKTTLCMCQNFRNQLEGWCHCHLFYKEKKE